MKYLFSILLLSTLISASENPFGINSQELVRRQYSPTKMRLSNNEISFDKLALCAYKNNSSFDSTNDTSVITSNADLFKIKPPLLLKGGGVLGAQWGFWIGKTAVYAASAVVITGVGVVAQVVCPIPGSGAVASNYVAIAMAPAIETASNAVGIATGIYGAVTTGPV